MKNIINLLFHRITIFSISIILQALSLIIIIWRFSNYLAYFYTGFTILSILAVLYIVNKDSNPEYKIAWIIPIMAFPIFGGVFYPLFGKSSLSERKNNKMQVIDEKMEACLR